VPIINELREKLNQTLNNIKTKEQAHTKKNINNETLDDEELGRLLQDKNLDKLIEDGNLLKILNNENVKKIYDNGKILSRLKHEGN
jgi:hypothetical protein